MEQLLRSLESLKQGQIGVLVDERMREFRAKGGSDGDGLFQELCFCLLTANYTSEGGMRMQKEIGSGFITLPPRALAGKLKKLGYRFPNARARYIVEARAHHGALRSLLSADKEDAVLREWLAENVLGLGYKEASHFLRNIGRSGFAIIDFHILDVLFRHGLIPKPKSRSLTKKRYLEIESVLGQVAQRAGMSQGELDLYLWFMETGKILK
jgi:N-glycosylase/DNA lyase